VRTYAPPKASQLTAEEARSELGTTNARDNKRAPQPPRWRNQHDRSAGPRAKVSRYFCYQTGKPTGNRNYFPLPPRDSQGPRTQNCRWHAALWQPKGQTESGRGQETRRDCRSNTVLAGSEGGRPRSNGAAVVFPLVAGSTHTKHQAHQAALNKSNRKTKIKRERRRTWKHTGEPVQSLA
jgi:hypothetical protein